MNFITINDLLVFNVLCAICIVFAFGLVWFSQMIASKYFNDEGKAESILNSEWTKISKSLLVAYIDLGRGNQCRGFGLAFLGIKAINYILMSCFFGKS